MALGSAGLAEDVNVEAPLRTCTGGQSKLAGNGGTPVAADALALAPLELNQSGRDGTDGIEGSDEQPVSSAINRAGAANTPPRGNLASVTPTPHMSHD
jgi:hypothetical protein